MNHDERIAMIEAMRCYGGSFVKALAEAFVYADAANTARLEAAYPDYVSRYRKMAATEGGAR